MNSAGACSVVSIVVEESSVVVSMEVSFPVPAPVHPVKRQENNSAEVRIFMKSFFIEVNPFAFVKKYFGRESSRRTLLTFSIQCAAMKINISCYLLTKKIQNMYGAEQRKKSVWQMPTALLKSSHFAVFCCS